MRQSQLANAKLLAVMDLADEFGKDWAEEVKEKYGEGKEPVAQDISVITNVPQNVDLQKFEEWVKKVERLELENINRNDKLGVRSLITELRQ